MPTRQPTFTELEKAEREYDAANKAYLEARHQAAIAQSKSDDLWVKKNHAYDRYSKLLKDS